MNHKKAFLRMLLVRGLGLRSAHALLGHFKQPEAVFRASRQEIGQLGIPPDVIDDLLSQRSTERAEAEWAKAGESHVTVVDILDPTYPSLLKEIFDPPLLLYVRGKRWPPELPLVAIVGTRKPTGYGINCAERVAEDLAARGVGIISGLARGIDAAAHRGALRAGTTYAVFGSGIDILYPKENRKLAELVEENGAIISEFPIGTPPSPENFPIRNRIISGMSLGTMVVEAAEYSGSLITARLALDAGRDVFAVPGNITSPNSFGPHALIRQGAKLVTSWQDVVEEMPYAIRESILAPLVAQMKSSSEPELHGHEETLWKALSVAEPISVDALLAKIALPPAEIYNALLELELRKYVRQLPGKKYIRRL